MDRTIQRFAMKYFEALNTPLSLSCYMLVKAGEWDQIARKRIDPRTYERLDAARFERDYLAVELLRKFAGMEIPGTDRRQAALEAFTAAEQQCAWTNLRLDPYLTDPLSEDCDPHVCDFLSQVRRRVRQILGRLPDDLMIKFGPGSTFETKGLCPSSIVLGDKLELGIHLTPAAADLSAILYRTAWGRGLVEGWSSRSGITYIRGNRFFTVPKDALIERGACAEGGAQVALQLAVGRVIRQRLAFVCGIDLKRGQETHAVVAKKAALTGDFVTIDLKSASDTIARKLVDLVLPQDWACLLKSLRSPVTTVTNRGESKVVFLEKFSSMGNGFTFELETLIFYSIAESLSPDQPVWVYGDDIIVHKSKAEDVLAALRFFGFTPNERKTFTTGHFRESCGTDVFHDVVVAPYRLTTEPASPAEWISVLNGALRVLRSLGTPQKVCSEVTRGLLAEIPRAIRVYGPSGLGDLCIHTPDGDYSKTPKEWVVKWRDGIRYVRCWVPFTKKVSLEYFRGGIQMALALYGVSSQGQAPRAIDGFVHDWIPYS